MPPRYISAPGKRDIEIERQHDERYRDREIALRERERETGTDCFTFADRKEIKSVSALHKNHSFLLLRIRKLVGSQKIIFRIS